MPDGDRIDSTMPDDYKPLAQADVDEMAGTVQQLDTVIKKMHQDIDVANEAVNALASWANVVSKLVDVAAPMIQKYMTKSGVPAEQHPSRIQDLIAGLGSVAVTPPDQRGAAVLALIQNLVK